MLSVLDSVCVLSGDGTLSIDNVDTKYRYMIDYVRFTLEVPT